MTRQRVALSIGGGIIAALLLGAAALAANPQVHVGNFYYEDATVGDGKVEATIGDQITFIFDDNGPGTPHTATVDGLFDSGNVLAGKTWTSPQIQKAGTYRLYCRNHQAKGHVTTLLVYQADGTLPTVTTTTTAPPSTTAPPATTTTTSAAGAPTATPTTTTTTPKTTATAPAITTTTAAPASATTTAPQTLAAQDATPVAAAEVASGDTIPTGTGTASADQRATAPVNPDSLKGLLGRKAPTGPWTRSIRLALAALAPMVLLGGIAVARSRPEDDPN